MSIIQWRQKQIQIGKICTIPVPAKSRSRHFLPIPVPVPVPAEKAIPVDPCLGIYVYDMIDMVYN
jgi:hypothetical protein